MLEHLSNFEPLGEFVELDDASADELLSAQVAAADWLEELGAKPDAEVNKESQVQAARQAFGSLTTTATDEATKEKLIQLKTPEAVRHVVGMLTAYDWEFVQQAKELRGYTVAKLVEETANPNPNVRLKALGLLGKVTEVGLFTDKIEVKKVDLTEDEINRKLKDKLDKLMGVSDIDATDVEEKDERDTDA
jgi:hypothetical protein